MTEVKATMMKTKPSRQKAKQKMEGVVKLTPDELKNGNEPTSTLGLEKLAISNQQKIEVRVNGKTGNGDISLEDHLVDLTLTRNNSYSDEGYNTLTTSLLDNCEERKLAPNPKNLKVVSLAPTAEQEEFEDDKEEENHEFINGDIADNDDSIPDSDYSNPSHQQFYNLAESAGHFLAGGAGLDSLSYSTGSGPGSLDGNHAQPALAACSTIWDGVIHLCEISSCAKPASKKCSSCKKAFYCGEEHQKQNWKKHKHNCTPYKMEILSVGVDGASIHGMVATRGIPPGHEVFSEKPFLIFPLVSDSDFEHYLDCPGLTKPELCKTARKPACFGCMKIVEFIGPSRYQCPNCNLPLCSEMCAFETSHSLGECQAISSCGGLSEEDRAHTCYHGLYMDVEILRALQLGNYDTQGYIRFLELRNNVRVDVYKQSSRFQRFSNNFLKLVPCSAKISGYNFDLIADVHAIITACSFRPSLGTPYKCLFSTQLLFLHDCTPNTVHYVEDENTADQLKMKLVVKAAIAIGKGEAITIDFLPTPYLPYPSRRVVLKNLGFDCNCRRCICPPQIGDFTTDIKCTQCKDGFISPENAPRWNESVWSCRRCQEEMSFSYVQKLNNEFEMELCLIPKTRFGISQLLDFISRGKKRLNPAHGLVIAAWCFIESILRQKLSKVREPDTFKIYDRDTYRDFELIDQYCDAVEPHLSCIRQGLWVDKGILQFNKFYSQFVLASKDYRDRKLDRRDFTKRIFKCMKILQEALQTLTVFEGMNATKHIPLLTQEGTGALATLKDFAAKLITQPQPEYQLPPHFTVATIGHDTKTFNSITGSLSSTKLPPHFSIATIGHDTKTLNTITGSLPSTSL